MANAGPNPTRLVADHLPAHIAELEADLKAKVGEVLKIQVELAVARTLLAVSPPDPKEETKK